MKILLTGASGFIGSHILEALIAKFGKESITLLSSKEHDTIETVLYNNIRNLGIDKEYFNDITHIIHAGAFTPKNALEANDIDNCYSNISFTKELLSFSLLSLKRFINLSTLDVYAPTNHVVSETSEIGPISLYGSSKLYCEDMVKSLSSQKEFEYLNLRIGHVYGPGEEKYKKVLPTIIDNILRDEGIEQWGDGSDIRSFIFISDVVESIVNAIDSTVSNLDINVVSGKSMTIKELINKVINVSGKQISVNVKPSNHQKRNLVFNNNLLLMSLLKKETDITEGLAIEYNYMKLKYENNI